MIQRPANRSRSSHVSIPFFPSSGPRVFRSSMLVTIGSPRYVHEGGRSAEDEKHGEHHPEATGDGCVVERVEEEPGSLRGQSSQDEILRWLVATIRTAARDAGWRSKESGSRAGTEVAHSVSVTARRE